MSLELLKVLVQPVVLERDGAGAIVGERLGEVVPLYSLGDIARFVETAEVELERANNGDGVVRQDGAVDRQSRGVAAMSEPTEPTTPAPNPEPEPGDGGDDDES